LSYKAKDEAILVLEDFNMDTPKTKEFAAILKSLQVDGKKTLIVVPENNENIAKSARNLQKANVSIAYKLNTYDILNANNVIFTESSLSKVDELFKA